MSLRTRRSLGFMASLLLVAVACTGTTPATTQPTASTPAGATATPGAPATPTAPGTTATPGTPTQTATPGTPESVPPSLGGVADPSQQIFRIYCCSSDPRSFHPQAASGSDEISIIGGINRGLLYYDKNLGLVPALATAMPTVSADGLTYTYDMRTDAKYSDGTTIVAGDIVRAAKQLADPRNAFDYGYEMCYVEGVDAVMGSDFGCSGDTPYLDPAAGTFDDAVIQPLLDAIGVTAPDDHTVVFKLKVATSYWPNITGMWLLDPVHPTETSWAEAANIVSSGPFMMSEWVHNSSIVLVPNPNWYGTPPTLQRIEIGIGGDPAAAVAAFERGDLDEVGLPSSDIRRVLDDPNLNTMVNRGTTLSVEYYDFANCQAKDSAGKILCPPNAAVPNSADVPGGSPTQNTEFRQALTQGLDRNELLQVGFAGIGAVAYSPTMPGIPGFPTITEANNPFPFDVTAALAHMSTALDQLGIGQPDPADADGDGIPDAVNALMVVSDPPAATDCDQTCATTKARVQLLAPLKFGYNCDAGHDQRVLYIAQKWRENLGFSGQQMDIRCTDFGTFRTERRAGNVYDIARNGWGADFPHPDNQNRDLFACGAGNNNSKYCNPNYDALLNQGAQAADYAAAEPFYHQAEQLLVKDAPVLFLRFGEGVRLIRPWVSGLTQTVSDHQNVGDVFYETIQILTH